MELTLNLSHPGGMRRRNSIDGLSGCPRFCSRKLDLLVSFTNVDMPNLALLARQAYAPLAIRVERNA